MGRGVLAVALVCGKMQVWMAYAKAAVRLAEKAGGAGPGEGVIGPADLKAKTVAALEEAGMLPTGGATLHGAAANPDDGADGRNG